MQKALKQLYMEVSIDFYRSFVDHLYDSGAWNQYIEGACEGFERFGMYVAGGEL